MKLFFVLFAVLAAASAVPLDPWALQNPWQQSAWQQSAWQQDPWQQNPWQQNPWQQNPWQNPWQQSQQIVKKVIPVHHAPQHIEAHHVPQQPPIPPLHPQPLKLKVHAHSVKIPYAYPKIPHPHLIGYEVAVHEPEVKHVVKPVHHAPVHSW